MREAISYQVELRAPGNGLSAYWGVSQEGYTIKAEALAEAKRSCPDGWRWRIVRVSLDVVEEGAPCDSDGSGEADETR